MLVSLARPCTSRSASRALFALMLLGGSLPSNVRAQVPGVEHFVVIGIDGLSTEGVRRTKTPVLQRMMAEGAWTLHARGVMPTSSSPNWASMIMGAGPEQHGVLSNDWKPGDKQVEPTEVGTGGIFPTIFGQLRQQKPSSKIACFHDWDDFGRLVERNVCDKLVHPKGPVETTNQAIAYLKDQKPNFLFIHLDHVDHAGHEHGHGTPAYDKAIAEADHLIGEVLTALEDAGIADKSVVLITSDHGGKGKGHGGASMVELEIPWILSGHGVAHGREISAPVNTFDTAATIAYVLGVTPPRCWIGRPVIQAFAETK
ncbi:alkaline phosphatase [Singulisphaera rosea]